MLKEDFVSRVLRKPGLEANRDSLAPGAQLNPFSSRAAAIEASWLPVGPSPVGFLARLVLNSRWLGHGCAGSSSGHFSPYSLTGRTSAEGLNGWGSAGQRSALHPPSCRVSAGGGWGAARAERAGQEAPQGGQGLPFAALFQPSGSPSAGWPLALAWDALWSVRGAWGLLRPQPPGHVWSRVTSSLANNSRSTEASSLCGEPISLPFYSH